MSAEKWGTLMEPTLPVPPAESEPSRSARRADRSSPGAIIGLVRHAVQEVDAVGFESESIGSQSVTYELADDVVGRHLGRAKRFDEPDFYGGVGVI